MPSLTMLGSSRTPWILFAIVLSSFLVEPVYTVCYPLSNIRTALKLEMKTCSQTLLKITPCPTGGMCKTNGEFSTVCTGNINDCLITKFVQDDNDTIACTNYKSYTMDCLETCEPISEINQALAAEFKFCSEGQFSISSCSRTANNSCRLQNHNINRTCTDTAACLAAFNNDKSNRCNLVEKFDFQCITPCYGMAVGRKVIADEFYYECEEAEVNIQACKSTSFANTCRTKPYNITKTCTTPNNCLSGFVSPTNGHTCSRYESLSVTCTSECTTVWRPGAVKDQMNTYFEECPRAEVKLQTCAAEVNNNCRNENHNIVTNCTSVNTCLKDFTISGTTTKCNRVKNFSMRCIGSQCHETVLLRQEVEDLLTSDCLRIRFSITNCPEKRTNCWNLSSSLSVPFECTDVNGCFADFVNRSGNSCRYYEKATVECIQRFNQPPPDISIDPPRPRPPFIATTTTTTTTTTTPPPTSSSTTTSTTTAAPTPTLIDSTTNDVVVTESFITTPAVSPEDKSTPGLTGAGSQGASAGGNDDNSGKPDLKELLLVVCGCLAGVVLMLFIIIWIILKYRKKQRLLTDNAVYYDPSSLPNQMPYGGEVSPYAGAMMGGMMGGKMGDEPIYMEVPGAVDDDVLKYPGVPEEDYLKVLSPPGPPSEPAPLPPKDDGYGGSSYDNSFRGLRGGPPNPPYSFYQK